MLRKPLLLSCVALVLAVAAPLRADEPGTAAKSPADLLKTSKRIVFLGDSITAAGAYVAAFDAWLLTRKAEQTPVVINAGLPSETVSGLSEEGHAGGKFPRPDLAERLERVLDLTKPDLVVACYGINCGIYQPFDETRFMKYQAGMKHVKAEVEKRHAKFIVMTPPFYDDLRKPADFSYNAVLDRYSEWLVEQRSAGWTVIDLHGPMTRHIQTQRKTNPEFTVQPDAVHPNEAGSWLVARELIAGFGERLPDTLTSAAEMLKAKHIPEAAWPLIQQRAAVRRDAYVATAGHKRPGVAAGLPVPEAEKKAEELTAKLVEIQKSK